MSAPLREAVLAALIIHALWRIIASHKMYGLRLASQIEFWFGVLALAGVLLIDALPGVLIVRIDAQEYYANALTVRDRVKAMIAEADVHAPVLEKGDTEMGELISVSSLFHILLVFSRCSCIILT